MQNTQHPFSITSLILWISCGSLIMPLVINILLLLSRFFPAPQATQIINTILGPLVLISYVAAQWLIIREHLRPSTQWLINAMIGWVCAIALVSLGFKLFFSEPTLSKQQIVIVLYGMFALVGAIIGFFQMRSLSAYKKSSLMILANCVGFVLTVHFVGIQIGTLREMILVGFFPSLLSGLALWYIFKYGR